jgi:DNA modification methylase
MKIHCKYDALVNPKDLQDHPKNRNKHGQDQIDRLAELYKYHGIRHPIIVSNLTKKIVAGHGRKLAAIRAGVTEMPVVYQDFDSTEAEYAFIQADNAIALWADLDLAGINSDIGDLGPDFNIDMLGIKDFVLEFAEKFEPQSDEDEVPEHVEPKTKLGDIYKLGNHRLMCGDSTIHDVVGILMDGKDADMVFTDPPYGYEYESNFQKKHSVLKNDDKFLDFFGVAYSFMAENSAIYVCGSHQTICTWKPLLETTFNYKNMIVWKKNNWSMGDLKGSFAGQHELILFAHKGKVKLNGERSRDIWEFDRDPPKDHPTQKPIPLIEFAINKASKKDDNILDLFGGSGSTLIACEKTNRKCFMMELDPHYVDIIIARWEKFTGKKAELIHEPS